MREGPMAEHLRQVAARAMAAARPLLPKRWRRGFAVVPVVRLTGVIGLAAPLRGGLSIGGIAKTLWTVASISTACSASTPRTAATLASTSLT